MLRTLGAILAAVAIVAGCSPGPTPTASGTSSAAASGPRPVDVKVVVSGLADPVEVSSARDGTGRLFVLEQAGRIQIVRDGALVEHPFLDITGRIASGGERGLLGIAFHPGYPTDPRVFVDYTDVDGNTVVSSFRVDPAKKWPDPSLATNPDFPGVSLAALKFMHLQRKILFHGHEPLDTDTTPTLESETWLLRNGYSQAEAVANLRSSSGERCACGHWLSKTWRWYWDYARYITICPPEWRYGVKNDSAKESPLPKAAHPLVWDDNAGMRVRK